MVERGAASPAAAVTVAFQVAEPCCRRARCGVKYSERMEVANLCVTPNAACPSAAGQSSSDATITEERRIGLAQDRGESARRPIWRLEQRWRLVGRTGDCRLICRFAFPGFASPAERIAVSSTFPVHPVLSFRSFVFAAMPSRQSRTRL